MIKHHVIFIKCQVLKYISRVYGRVWYKFFKVERICEPKYDDVYALYVTATNIWFFLLDCFLKVAFNSNKWNVLVPKKNSAALYIYISYRRMETRVQRRWNNFTLLLLMDLFSHIERRNEKKKIHIIGNNSLLIRAQVVSSLFVHVVFLFLFLFLTVILQVRGFVGIIVKFMRS